jgi:hypothetical protein
VRTNRVSPSIERLLNPRVRKINTRRFQQVRFTADVLLAAGNYLGEQGQDMAALKLYSKSRELRQHLDRVIERRYPELKAS